MCVNEGGEGWRGRKHTEQTWLLGRSDRRDREAEQPDLSLPFSTQPVQGEGTEEREGSLTQGGGQQCHPLSNQIEEEKRQTGSKPHLSDRVSVALESSVVMLLHSVAVISSAGFS